MSVLLKGTVAAAALDGKTAAAVNALKERGMIPCLATLRVGESESALSYEYGVFRQCEKLGIAVKQTVLSADVSQKKLIEAIHALNESEDVHGVLIFRPLPDGLDEQAACAALAPEKDVDGITAASMSKVYSGAGSGFAPCTAAAVMELLRFYGIDPSGKRAVVIGRSLVAGRPLAMLLLRSDATVTVCHTKTQNLCDIVREADIAVAAIGKAEYVGKEFLRKGQIVIDVGINWSESKQRTVGDVCFDEAEGLVSAISPVPGGVGSMTTAVLLSHVVKAAERRFN